MPIFLVFILVPILELWVIATAADWLGWGVTLLCIFFTAIIGVRLLKKQSSTTLSRAAEKWQNGQLPTTELLEGIMLTFSGAFLLTPGFITDLAGFLLLMPLIRKHIINRITNYGTDRFVSNFTHSKYSFHTSWGNNTDSGNRSGFRGGLTIEGKATKSTLKPAANQDQHDPTELDDGSKPSSGSSNSSSPSKPIEEKDILVDIRKPPDPPEDK